MKSIRKDTRKFLLSLPLSLFFVVFFVFLFRFYRFVLFRRGERVKSRALKSINAKDCFAVVAERVYVSCGVFLCTKYRYIVKWIFHFWNRFTMSVAGAHERTVLTESVPTLNWALFQKHQLISEPFLCRWTGAATRTVSHVERRVPFSVRTCKGHWLLAALKLSTHMDDDAVAASERVRCVSLATHTANGYVIDSRQTRLLTVLLLYGVHSLIRIVKLLSADECIFPRNESSGFKIESDHNILGEIRVTFDIIEWGSPSAQKLDLMPSMYSRWFPVNPNAVREKWHVNGWMVFNGAPWGLHTYATVAIDFVIRGLISWWQFHINYCRTTLIRLRHRISPALGEE